MDANLVFKTILQQVEASQLNYSLSKTPFSATISLKSSFIKRFKGEPINYELVDANRTDVEKLKSENSELKETVKSLKECLASQKEANDEHFIQEKVKSKIVEKETADHHEELIHIKKEKNKLLAQIKTLQGENDHFVSEIKFFKDDADECKKSLNRNIKKHDEKVKKIEKDKQLLKINEKELQKQVLDFKLQIEKLKPITEKIETGNQTESFECINCDKICLTEQELKQHVKLNHDKKTKDSSD